MPSWVGFTENETSSRKAGERVGAKNGCRLKPQRPEMPAAQGVFGLRAPTKYGAVFGALTTSNVP